MSESHDRMLVDTAPVGSDESAPRAAQIADAKVIQDRYFLLERLGEGGFGTVYSAYDRALDRRVALKLMHARFVDAGDGVGRLLREARAMARLAHPNVVAVYDIGVEGEQAFVTMELVEGQSLRVWLDRRRPWREVLAVFLAAGRGLAAAHASGLVHRDFKPDNVLIGRDGSVRVADFGLARLVRALEAMDVPARPGLASGYELVTVPGAAVGTPRYMAPEQRRAQPPDTRSDQFSFCVALYEGLYRAHPFPEKDVEVPEPPRRSDVPAWVQRAILRGLAHEPEARFPGMDDLLRALGRDPVLRRRRALLSAGAAAVVMVLGAWGVRTALQRAHQCDAAARRGADIWTPEARERVHATFAATGAPFAEDVFATAAAGLDRQLAALSAAGRTVCEAVEVRHEQPPAIARGMGRCLDDRQQELAALTALFLRADRIVVQNAPNGVAALGAVAPCTQAQRAFIPADPALALKVDGANERLIMAYMLGQSGKPREARPQLVAVAEEAERLGYRPLEARALAALAALELDEGDGARELAAEMKAFAAAVAAHDDILFARSAIRMVVTYGTTMAKPAEAARWGEVARAAVERTGGPELAAQLELALAQADTDARQGDAALSHLDRALVATLQMSPPNPMFLAAIYNERGNAKQARGLPGEAGVEYRRAYEVTVAQLGPRHPRALVIETNIAASLMDLGRAAEALESLRRTAAQMEITFGADKQQTLMTKFNLGAAALEAGALDEAAAAFALAKAGLEKQVGPDHPAVIRARRGLATVASRRGDHAAARAELLAVLATQEAELGKESGDLVRTLMLLGQDYAADGKRREAEAYLARALALAEKVLGPQHVETAEVRAAQAAMR